MKKKLTLIIIVLTLAAGAGAWWYFGIRNKTKPIQLDTEKPQYGYISKSVTATGTIEPVDTVTVGSQVSGTIKYIYADFNDVVRKGEVIAELDKSLFEATVNQYKANLELAKSNLTYQENNFSRQSQLYQAGGISRADYDNAENLHETAKATVKSVEAQLEGAQKNLSYATIYSPVNGVVLSRNISIGQTVAASFSTPTLFIIAKDIKKMQVQAAVDEADIGNVTVGQRAVFTVDAYPSINFYGKVSQIRLKPQVSANVVTYTTIIDAPNEDLKLKPGMTANIFVYTHEDSNALLIPVKALKYNPSPQVLGQFRVRAGEKQAAPPAAQPDNRKKNLSNTPTGGNAGYTDSSGTLIQQSTVWIKSGDSLLKKEIYTGLNDDMHVQVISGLSPEDDLVISQGADMTPVKSPASPARSPFMPTRRPAATSRPAANR